MTTIHRITAAAAVILSLAAANAPTAAAGTTATQPATVATHAPATVYSRPDKAVIRVTTPHDPGVYSRPDKSMIVATTPDGARGARTATAPQAVVHIQTPSGFDWGDAGIGAGGALGVMLAATGGTLLLAHRRTQSRTAN